jgi:hypothetical protein
MYVKHEQIWLALESTSDNLAIQVSDALVKLQKIPEGGTVRGGFLADLGKTFPTSFPRHLSTKV